MGQGHGVGCTAAGTLDDSRFNEPMPWIGLYVVAASAACATAMALDAFHGFRYRKFMFPCRFFALNATTLALISVAVKLSLDLNTSMPRPHDQLAKLSSTAFICTAIPNSMPSLGNMQTKELVMNVVALGILVLTLLVNVCIQLATGVIYVFWVEHAVIMFIILLLYAILVSSSLAIPATKYYFDLKYAKQYQIATAIATAKKESECGISSGTSTTRKLRDDLLRYWMMAHTCNPQFVMGRLATCTASGAFCLLSAATLAEAMLRTYLMPWCFTFCTGDSDYKWSAVMILATQAIAVVVGTIAPASRWFTAISFMCPCTERSRRRPIGFSSVEAYWVKKLCMLKEYPLDLRLCRGGQHQQGRRFVHNTKNMVVDLCILIQKGMVVLSKAVRLISIMIARQLLTIHQIGKKVFCLVPSKNTSATTTSFNCDTELDTCNLDLSPYVLRLEGEDELTHLMMESDRGATGHWIRMGRKRQPKHLMQLLDKLNLRGGVGDFEGVHTFDSEQVPSLESEEPPNSWALPVVTLTSIAAATSEDFRSVAELIKGVHEGLKYIRIVESNLDIKRDLTRIRKAAEIVWNGVDLHCKWLDVDLREMALQGRSQRETISALSDVAKHKFMELRKTDAIGCLSNIPSTKWPFKAVATNSMYRICQTLLLPTENSCSDGSNGVLLLNKLTAMITDIIGATLTNLQHAISVKCHQSSIEQREECARSAFLLLGKTEHILEILSGQQLPSSDPQQMACINEWRAALRRQRFLRKSGSNSSSSSSINSDSSSDFTTSSASELKLDININV
ncbi:uncharacterized protein LOC127255513 [Andrographis paniculata]|uniref:uncharacterized protein LOC127255513 n=1 Tax=Andrographis paniculata TaxID=175694 RepID=UPI0021E702E0|nr:uncharacterized protein LOC127255513 [Andrographis paniculata]XP_051137008.1 uncharacterized protein LOC127255513 [Andrographis paniculata]XP_051137009.1 uncharacterized protein LOC127255513 [Andrographis paniculata]XP_051137010.1 uncharacterized protein LOC127255513 [Andrographis paniculata]